MKRSKLSADIANLLKPFPSEFDEEDHLDDTSAKVLTADSDESDYGEINEKSRIRTQNIDLLDTVDEKYVGKVSNRRSYKDSDSDDEPAQDTADISTYSDDNDEETFEEDEFGENNSSEESEIEETNDASDNSDANEEDARNFKHFTDSTLKDESNKGLAVRKQLNVWENLLEMRIKMKKSLSASNNLPVGEKFKEVLDNMDEEFKNKLAQTKKNVQDILRSMISLQTLLLNKYPSTKNLLSNKNKDKDDEDEITSEEDSDEEVEVKRRKTDYGTVLSERHELYKKYRNNTIEKWYDKTRIKHTESNSHTIVDQINHILMDKSKLLKKTQLKRSDYKIIGENDEEEDYNVNIYDDEDFYHQQLKELVEFKSSDITDPLQLSRQWVQLQNMRSKMKRKIDTRATKGRKLKFVVHSKLVNHVACREYDDSKTEDAKKELISSLFQKKI